MGNYAINLKDVSVSFNGVSILEDITFSLKKNIFLGVIGPNGGGKTTLLKVILGLIQPDKGTVEVFGKSPVESRKLIGYVPQYRSFDSGFPISVFDTVLMGRYGGVFGNYSGKDRETVADILETVGMSEFKDRRVGDLSGGQIQRVFVARALVREPMMLLLDEPTTGIDLKMHESFYELLSELKKKMTILLVTHDIGVVSVYVDDVACLNKRLVYHESKEATLKDIGELYGCPIELIGHGAIPHRVLGRHKRD